jgi:peptide deformylase
MSSPHASPLAAGPLTDNLKIVQYPHPTLRHASKPLKRVDAELQAIVRRMFELMYEHKGVGLAANQVDLPYRLFIVNLKSDPKESEEHVFLNPVLSRPHGLAEAEEGCLSLPELYAQVKRAEKITLDAFDLQGQSVRLELDGLFARVVQHETDHLDGKLFIDRLNTTGELAVNDALRQFKADFASRRERGEIPSDAQIAARLAELEKLRT